ncbi:exodeoxyribonuclease V subunit alpha [Ramlibacter sp.]|uniref:exodeoxyribonuclease V subunit alpha n=1 Tax=Ramlibacter sp. TaxID=1917967 RepID=UPI003D0F4B93
MNAGILAQAFAGQVAKWAARRGASPEAVEGVRVAAQRVSEATSNGHVCALLDEVGVSREALLASGVVGTPDAAGANPLIVDDEGRLYLHRYFDYERRLARRLIVASAVVPAQAGTQGFRVLAERLASLFPPSTEVDWQKIAAALALRGRLTIVSGGPGTGKTTTVVNLLACLLEQDPDARIALAAPTGKAAARMTEAIRARAQHLPEALRDKLPQTSSTIHRLLRYNPQANAFGHDAARPLAIDALIVDEASMLDIALATKLLEAVPEHARIILLGDKDQLAAVEAGAVFAELGADPSLTSACREELALLCGIDPGHIEAPPASQHGALSDAVVWLTRNYRFAADSGIGRLAADVNAGRVDEAVEWLANGDDESVVWREGEGAAAAIESYAPYFEVLGQCLAVPLSPEESGSSNAVTRAFSAFRALCATREGPEGVDAINDAVTRHARARFATGPSPWFPGRPVMVTRNDYVMKLFNGDIGIALPDASGELVVHFPEGEGFRAVPTQRMPAHETAFAMTVHKSQGSEFDEVLVVLPRHASRVLSRELLYTAVTRARERVTLVASEESLRPAIGERTARRSGLAARLREAQTART